MPKHGFRIVYHKDIPLEEIQDFLEEHKSLFTSPRSYKTGGYESHSFYKRGIFGLTLNEDCIYTFRRLSSKRRIFGVVPVSLLERKDGEPLYLKQCMCSLHRGGQKVQIIGGFKEEDFITFYEEGEIRG